MKKYVLIAVVLLFVVVSAFFLFYGNDEVEDVESFDDCMAAGFAVMESYPRQCIDDDGNVFIEEVDMLDENDFVFEDGEDVVIDPDGDEYYGSSTLAPCESSEDCIEGGCNGEICMGTGEEPVMSICVVPDEPLPSELGFVCGCFENLCQWTQ